MSRMTDTGAAGVSMPDWLARRAALSPDRLALVAGGERFTFAELHARAGLMAQRLAALGVSAGERVAVLLRNGVPFVEIVHALTRLRAVLVPLNTRLSPAELAWQMGDAQASMLLYDAQAAAAAAGMGGVARVAVGPDAGDGGPALAEVSPGAVRLATHVDLQAAHCILYTSGTTGRPKGAMLTYGNHWWSATASAFNLGNRPDDRWLACLPLFHVSGLSILMRSVIYGIPAVVHASFDPDAVNRAIEEERVTIVSVVSAMLSRMLEAHGDRPYPEWFRCALAGGGPVPLDLLEACVRRGVPVVQTYGLTETASQVVTLAPGAAQHKIGSAGLPLFPNELRIERAEASAGAGAIDAAPGEVGEIVVHGPTVMAGYWGRPEETARILRDGWLHTGDLGYLDEEGYLYVIDRRDDLIISGGENIYPAEVEAVLLSHPDVAEAGVTGVSDARWGRAPVAAVQRRPGGTVDEAALVAFCQQRLAGYKVPVRIRFVERLPRNAAGKLLRRELGALVGEGSGRVSTVRVTGGSRRPAAAPIFCHDVGIRTGTPFVFVHGDFTAGDGAWTAQRQALADSCRLIVPDRRGFGRSPQAPRPYTIAGDALDVLEAADRASLRAFHLVGHSYGGLVALEAARLAPARMLSLHLIEPPYFALLPQDPEVAALAERGRGIFEAARGWEPERIALEFFAMLLGPEGAAGLRERRAWPAIVREAGRIAHAEFPGEYPAGAGRQLSTAGPVRVYTGGRSHPALQKLARCLAERIPRARLVEVPEAGHDVHRSGEPFNRSLLQAAGLE